MVVQNFKQPLENSKHECFEKNYIQTILSTILSRNPRNLKKYIFFNQI